MTTKDEIAKLKQELADQRARVAELEEKAKPPAPFVPQPHQRYDPTANFTLPPSVVREMAAAVPPNFMQDVVRDNRAPSGPTGAIPSSSNVSGGNVAGSGTGWAREIPIGPSMHQRYVDAQLDAQDQRDRAEREAQFKKLEGK
jgi:hypothetical protein